MFSDFVYEVVLVCVFFVFFLRYGYGWVCILLFFFDSKNSNGSKLLIFFVRGIWSSYDSYFFGFFGIV